MPGTSSNNGSWLLRVAQDLVDDLKPRASGTALKLHKPEHQTVHSTTTQGWLVEIGTLGRGRGKPVLQVWLDHFSGHTERKLYVCFSSSKKEAIESMTNRVAKELWPVHVFTDDDMRVGKSYVLKKVLPRQDFNLPIAEHYDAYGHYFYGFYDPTQGGKDLASSRFINLATEFLLDVVNALPDSDEAIDSCAVYPRSEDRKLVASHLRRERSGFLAAQCKERDGYRCQVCEMSFAETYGAELGASFAEAHHKQPLGKMADLVKTTVDDLVTVCANCHRMLHRMDGNAGDLQRLKAIVLKNRAANR